MVLRKAAAYSKRKKVAYTRKSTVKAKAYIKTVPQIKIVKFVMGDASAFLQKKFPFLVELTSSEVAQIRDNAIEAARLFVHRKLEGLKGGYYFAVSCYPHQVLRENKMLVGAGADRMQTGMSLSFGASIGRAVQVKEGSKIFSVACMKEDIPFVRSALKSARSKLPCKCKIIVRPL